MPSQGVLPSQDAKIIAKMHPLTLQISNKQKCAMQQLQGTHMMHAILVRRRRTPAGGPPQCVHDQGGGRLSSETASSQFQEAKIYSQISNPEGQQLFKAGIHGACTVREGSQPLAFVFCFFDMIKRTLATSINSICPAAGEREAVRPGCFEVVPESPESQNPLPSL